MFNISINDLEKVIVGPGCLKFPLQSIGSPNIRSYLAKLGYTNEFQVKLRFNEVLRPDDEALHFLTPGSDGTVGELIEAVEKVLNNKLLLEGKFKTVSGPASDFEGNQLIPNIFPKGFGQRHPKLNEDREFIRQPIFGEPPFYTVEIEDNKMTSIDGKENFNLEDGAYKLVLMVKGSAKKIRENLGPIPSFLRSKPREIRIDCGVVVSDTQETESMVGIKMNLDSGIYQLQHGNWVLVNN